ARCQATTVFSLLLLTSACALARRRQLLGGALLGAACLVRYEAWGAVAALAVAAVFAHSRRARQGSPPADPPVGLMAVLPGVITIGVWLGLRARLDGSLLAFAFETRRFADGVRSAHGGQRTAGPA